MKSRHLLGAAVVMTLLVSSPILAAPVTTTTIAETEKILGLTFTPAQRSQMVELLNDTGYWGNRTAFESMRTHRLLNSDPPALVFNPVPLGLEFESAQKPISWSPPIHTARPSNMADLAFYSVRDLGELIRTRQLTSLELTTLCLERLKRYDSKLFCVVTLAEDLALPDHPYSAMSLIIDAEAAAAFDELTRLGGDALLTAQGRWDWPNLLRTARTIPAVEYLQADRLRHRLIQDMAGLMNTVDVWVASDLEEATLFISNLTGQPCVVIPNGDGTSLSFVGKLYDEATILALAKAYQDATSYHTNKPPLFVQ